MLSGHVSEHFSEHFSDDIGEDIGEVRRACLEPDGNVTVIRRRAERGGGATGKRRRAL